MVSSNVEHLSLAIVNSLIDQIALIDTKGTIIFVNESWISFASNNGGDLAACGIGANYFDYCGENREVLEGILSVLFGNKPNFTYEYPCDSAYEKRWFLMNVTPLLVKSEIKGATISHINITERKIMEEKLIELAISDTLTSLHNRRYLEKKFIEEMARASRYHHPISFIILDIDRFKNINDRHGHFVGDEVLIKIADTVLENTRETDICARIGGEEFAILLPETDEAEALSVARRVHSAIQDLQIPVGDLTLTVTVSMGIITKSSDFNMQDMMEETDKALYSAKNNGRNMICIV
ncbi:MULTISPECIES: sensor domain-containing diguanylate cyclase [unclassified Paenibacillus]|uniref:sensor domain-containing diguanylate cyclase n=1 Tax=unclassified Paenibacillus TaxID=185978 RepID=UPI001AE5083D|nr:MULTISPECIES: sensor domain-containing diguanylate cyclase [unclassified Paenibacillus]MBP1155889.1 diguanylate cyclase (GGDEF)-like protein [Paenibacillus sp. PvP091]MBP1168725.1 diguanylate cyclase (GGDEF)-like protein [Paenibacillus sp. PvR098]MBP2439753.1 diguanylate cyclase (GGDEF)-like protein [Paenibacillus sp. PvP052]